MKIDYVEEARESEECVPCEECGSTRLFGLWSLEIGGSRVLICDNCLGDFAAQAVAAWGNSNYDPNVFYGALSLVSFGDLEG
jgi:hypothetical protein